jgi:hypothetical protein
MAVLTLDQTKTVATMMNEQKENENGQALIFDYLFSCVGTIPAEREPFMKGFYASVEIAQYVLKTFREEKKNG